MHPGIQGNNPKAYTLMKMVTKCDVKIGAWNIHGLGKKLREDDVLDIVNNLDFVAFVETWTSIQSSVNFAGYGRCHKTRHKRHKKGRPHGGILFLYKSRYKGFVQSIDCDNEDVLIIRVKAEAIGHVRDLCIFIVYIPPGLPADKISERFEFLEQCLAQHSCHADTLIIGDLNSRTGSLSDLTDIGVDCNNLPIDLSDAGHVPDRNNCDQVVNSYGKRLIELCQSTQHYILNGRFLGDSLGYFTYMSKNGSSVVDYSIVNATLFKTVKYMRVTPFSHLSDHCLLDVCLSFNGTPVSEPTDDDELIPLYDR